MSTSETPSGSKLDRQVGPLAVAVMSGCPIAINPSVRQKRFQPGAWVLGAQDVGGTAVLVWAKWHDGWAWFDTEMGPSKEPRDYLRELCDLAHNFEVNLLYAYSVGLDAEAAKAHPDWAAREPDGSLGAQEVDGRAFAVMSLWSPYAGFVLGQLRELSGRYGPVGGVWLDALEPRFSWDKEAKAAFRKQHGSSAEKAPQEQRLAFAREAYADFVRRAAAAIREANPDAVLAAGRCGNQAWVPEEVDWVVAPADNADQAAQVSQWLRQQPGHVLLQTRDSTTWGQQVLKGAGRLMVEAAEVFTRGGRVLVGVRPTPAGQIFDAELSLVHRLHEWREARLALLGPATCVADVAVLVTPDEADAPFRRQVARRWPGAESSSGGDDPLAGGFQRALDEQHILFDVVDARDRFEGHRLVVLPEQTVLDPETLKRLRDYVRGGGRLLAEGHASLLRPDGTVDENYQLASVFGTDFVGYSSDKDGHYAYLVDRRLKSDLPSDYPIQIVGPTILTRLKMGWRLAKLVLPVASTGTTPAWSGGRPCGELTNVPAVTANRVGDGLAVYCPLPIGRHLATQPQTWWVSRLLANVLLFLLGEPTLQTDAPSAVRARLRQHEDGLALYLVNRLACQAGHTPPALAGCQVRLNTQQVGPIGSAQLVPGGQALEIATNGVWCEVRIPQLDPVATLVALKP